RQTVITRANMTAYSTAVGPSSVLTKRTIRRAIVLMASAPRVGVGGGGGRAALGRPGRPALRASAGGRRLELAADVGERVVGLAAQGGDGHQADDDDEG